MTIRSTARRVGRWRGWLAAAGTVALAAGMTMAAGPAAHAATDSSSAEAQAVNINLPASSLSVQLSDPATQATYSGNGSAVTAEAAPDTTALGDTDLLSIGALAEHATADADATSFACAGALPSDGALDVADDGTSCTATGDESDGLTFDLNKLAAIGDDLAGVGHVVLTADSLTAHAYLDADGLQREATISGLTAHVTPSEAPDAVDVPVTLTGSHNEDVLAATAAALQDDGDPALDQVITALEETVPSDVTLTANAQPATSDGVSTVSALQLGVVGDSTATLDIARASVGPNSVGDDDGNGDGDGSDQQVCPPNPFPDVDGSNIHCANIAWLKDQDITKPLDGLYHPVNPVNRGSMVAFIYRMDNPGKASPTCESKPFPDVDTDDLFCGYIQWAKNNHVAFGYSNGLYGPDKPVTRGAMAAFLHRLATQQPGETCTVKPFTDVETDDTFCGVITWMKDNKITFGIGGPTGGDQYGTAMPVTRQAMASFLHRIEGYVE